MKIVDILLLFSLCAFLIYATWYVIYNFTHFQKRLDELEDEILDIEKELKKSNEL